MKIMFTEYERLIMAKKKKLKEKRNSKREIGLPEDIRVHHSGEANPHDG